MVERFVRQHYRELLFAIGLLLIVWILAAWAAQNGWGDQCGKDGHSRITAQGGCIRDGKLVPVTHMR